MYKAYNIILFVSFILCTTVTAQQAFVDSLNVVLQMEKSELRKGRLNIMLGKEYISSDTLKAQEYFKKGLKLANSCTDNMGKGMYYLYTGYLQCNKGLYDEGLKSFDKSTELLKDFSVKKNISEQEKKENLSLLLDAELSRGNVQLELYEYEKAYALFLNVLKLLETSDIPDKDIAIASTYQSIALTLYHRAQYENALYYYLKAAQFAQKSSNEYVIAESNIYAAMCYTLVQKYDSSFFILNQVQPVVLKINNPQLNTTFYARMAEAYRFTEEWQQANLNYDKAIENAKQSGNIYMQATFSHAKARCLLKMNNIKEARNAAHEALRLAQSINKKREILEAQKVLSLIEFTAGDYKAAYQYIESYNKGNDSLKTAELTEKIVALDKKYETEKKVEQLKLQQVELKQRKTLNYALLAGIVLLITIIFHARQLYKRNQKLQKQRIRELETEKQLMATEAVLKGEEQERSRLAKDLHDGLGGLLSGIKYSFQNMKDNLILTPDNAQVFERSLDMLDSSIHEMRRVAHNLMPETLFRFGLDMALGDFCSAINNSGVLKLRYQSFGLETYTFDHSVSVSVYRIIQEMVNNIVKHATAGFAMVQLSLADNVLLIDVEDNGKGFDTQKMKENKGIGWSNIQSRLNYLNGKLELQSQPGAGTNIHIEISLK